MRKNQRRTPPGRVRDTIIRVMSLTSRPLSVKEIGERVNQVIGPTPPSSVRSYLRLNTPGLFAREERGLYTVHSSVGAGMQQELPVESERSDEMSFGKAVIHHADCFDWLQHQPDNAFHAVVTDPPYGLLEYTAEQQENLRQGRGGVWRIRASFDGKVRAPLLRFTTLFRVQLRDIEIRFIKAGRIVTTEHIQGTHVNVASNPLLS